MDQYCFIYGKNSKTQRTVISNLGPCVSRKSPLRMTPTAKHQWPWVSDVRAEWWPVLEEAVHLELLIRVYQVNSSGKELRWIRSWWSTTHGTLWARGCVVRELSRVLMGLVTLWLRCPRPALVVLYLLHLELCTPVSLRLLLFMTSSTFKGTLPIACCLPQFKILSCQFGTPMCIPVYK